MSPLMFVSESSPESKLSAANSKPPTTPMGLTSLQIENHLKNPKKSLPIPYLYKKFCSTKPKPERLTRTQAGMIIPVIMNTTKRSAEGTKDHLSPFQGFRVLGHPTPGVIPPSVVSSPLQGFLCFNVNDRIIGR